MQVQRPCRDAWWIIASTARRWPRIRGPPAPGPLRTTSGGTRPRRPLPIHSRIQKQPTQKPVLSVRSIEAGPVLIWIWKAGKQDEDGLGRVFSSWPSSSDGRRPVAAVVIRWQQAGRGAPGHGLTSAATARTVPAFLFSRSGHYRATDGWRHWRPPLERSAEQARWATVTAPAAEEPPLPTARARDRFCVASASRR